jgi:hypothetical protein
MEQAQVVDVLGVATTSNIEGTGLVLLLAIPRIETEAEVLEDPILATPEHLLQGGAVRRNEVLERIPTRIALLEPTRKRGIDARELGEEGLRAQGTLLR